METEWNFGSVCRGCGSWSGTCSPSLWEMPGACRLSEWSEGAFFLSNTGNCVQIYTGCLRPKTLAGMTSSSCHCEFLGQPRLEPAVRLRTSSQTHPTMYFLKSPHLQKVFPLSPNFASSWNGYFPYAGLGLFRSRADQGAQPWLLLNLLNATSMLLPSVVCLQTAAVRSHHLWSAPRFGSHSGVLTPTLVNLLH